MEEERKRFKNGLKNKDVQIEHLSVRNNVYSYFLAILLVTALNLI